MTTANRLLTMILCGSLLLMSGCLELDLHVKINDDGSATITEKLGYSEELLDLASASPKDRALLDKSLSKEGAMERMAKMGKGAELVSHDVADRVIADTLYKEATTVYKIPDINDLRLSPPFPKLWGDDDVSMRFILEPCYQRAGVHGGGGRDLPGYMAIQYYFASDKTDTKAKVPARQPPAPLSPVEAQRIRDLLPIIQEMARSASVKVTLEACNTLNDGWWILGGPHALKDRDNTHPVSYTELLNISGQNRDEFDRPLLSDEETLIEFIRGDWTGSHIRRLLVNTPRYRDFRFYEDGKVPLIYTATSANSSERYIFLPSLYQYKKFFAGKTFDDAFAPAPPKEK